MRGLDYLRSETQAKIEAARASVRDRQDVTNWGLPAGLCPSRVPLTIVCGPPGSGKSTHVLMHAAPDDLIIDLDEIVQEVTGRHGHSGYNASSIEEALERRNVILRSLATTVSNPRAWFIICAACPQERQEWANALGGTVEVITTPLDECIRRIKADPSRRARRAYMIAGAQSWWASNPHLQQKQNCAL